MLILHSTELPKRDKSSSGVGGRVGTAFFGTFPFFSLWFSGSKSPRSSARAKRVFCDGSGPERSGCDREIFEGVSLFAAFFFAIVVGEERFTLADVRTRLPYSDGKLTIPKVSLTLKESSPKTCR